MLSTCNRVEVYAEVESYHAGSLALRRFLSADGDVAPPELSEALDTGYEQQAVEHLFLVAAGLDSMVVGEPQILGQVRAAHRRARRGGCRRPGDLGSVSRGRPRRTARALRGRPGCAACRLHRRGPGRGRGAARRIAREPPGRHRRRRPDGVARGRCVAGARRRTGPRREPDARARRAPGRARRRIRAWPGRPAGGPSRSSRRDPVRADARPGREQGGRLRRSSSGTNALLPRSGGAPERRPACPGHRRGRGCRHRRPAQPHRGRVGGRTDRRPRAGAGDRRRGGRAVRGTARGGPASRR